MKKLLISLVLMLCFSSAVFAESPEEQELPPKGYIALTFDDGPSGALTEKLLDGLRDRGARATFFLCGYRMEQYPELMVRYAAEGHEVGLHSTVHADLTTLTPEEIHRDLKDTAQRIFIATGQRPQLLRPPGGAWDENVLQEAEDQGLSLILWSVDPRDWASRDAGAVLSTMAAKAGAGDIVLMHDLTESSVSAALRLVDTMQRSGYSFVTVSELAALTGRELTPGIVYRNFRSP